MNGEQPGARPPVMFDKHGAVILKDAVAIEVFAPVREDYLPDPAAC